MAEAASATPAGRRVARDERTPSQIFLREFRRNRGAVVGTVLFAILILMVLFAPYVTRFDPIEPNYGVRFSPPTAEHWFGTDRNGRDIYTRVVYGGRISLLVGVVAVAIGSILGTVLGLVSGFYGGLVDNAVMRFMDFVLAMPGILLAITIVFALGPSLVNVMIAVGFSTMPQYARVVRASVLSAKQLPYVEAARAAGAGDGVVMGRHILPNVFAPVLVLATLGLGSAVLSVAALSFLGLGAAPPTPEWGLLISDGRGVLRRSWWVATFPGLAIMVTVLAVNLIGDGLRDALDPRLRGQV
ncbi:MAG: ABC transporter permease [Trueperaceae bacterium]|nr:ABC transporter permease [Trueperaceae bacterium]